MGRKRKRTKALDTAPESEQSILHHRSKRARSDNGGVDKGEDPKKRIPIVPDKPVEHPVLACYFAQVFTLREHLLKLLVRIKSGPRPLRKLKAVTAENDADLSILLDTTLVGISGKPSPKITKQVHDHHVTQSSAGSRDSASQSETVDLVLQFIFAKTDNMTDHKGVRNDVLARGFNSNFTNGRGNAGALGIEVVSKFPNSQVNTLKGPLWSRLLQIIEQDAMLHLLLETSLFIPLGDPVRQNYFQLSGPPISDPSNDLETQMHKLLSPEKSIHGPKFKSTVARDGAENNPKTTKIAKETEVSAEQASVRRRKFVKTPELEESQSNTEIVFVKWRMFYAKPSHNKRGEVVFGLSHIHVLNRIERSAEGARIILKYMFPRQFGLHNVFTSVADKSATVQKFQDYTVRTDEMKDWALAYGAPGNGPVPKRLRGKPMELVQKMQTLHRRCAYDALIKYYCPVSLCDPRVRGKRAILRNARRRSLGDKPYTQVNIMSSANEFSPVAPSKEGETTKFKERFLDHASSTGQVSAFLRAVLLRIIPHEFLGGSHNRKVLDRMVDRFVRLRKHERLSLHDVVQGIKLTEIPWLCPSKASTEDKMSKTDENKRRELFAELFYWMFDSLIIPLVRAHFYVTETAPAKNRLFYFRHDAWKKLSEPEFDQLKLNMLTPFNKNKAQENGTWNQALGVAAVRLLPKEYGVRPIINLQRKVDPLNQSRTAKSVNQQLAPVRRVLTYEMKNDPKKPGSAIFSVAQMHPVLEQFKKRAFGDKPTSDKLYFVKVDVQACFDNIPQGNMFKLATEILESDEYRMDKYTDVQPPDTTRVLKNGAVRRPFPRWQQVAKPFDDPDLFSDYAPKLAPGLKKGSVLVDEVIFNNWRKRGLLDYLRRHLKHNIVKIGKRYYRQKRGIPQGSTLSSILCTLFYGDLERRKLSFMDEKDTILMRMVDDFLFITLDRKKATTFLKIMHEGIPEYGVTVSPSKTLVNFETSLHGRKVRRTADTHDFPYCGSTINMKTLAVKKDRDRNIGQSYIGDSLTVDYTFRPGASLLRKTINSFKINCSPLWLDTNFNPLSTVIKNLSHTFIEIAMKLHASLRSLAHAQLPIRPHQLLKIIEELFETSYMMVKMRRKAVGGKKFECAIRREEFMWVAVKAFKGVLGRKQTGYREVMGWLDRVERRLGIERKREVVLKARVGEGVVGVKY